MTALPGVTQYLDGLFGLSGRTAVVTGGSSGIGLAVAVALGRAGAQVVIVARGREALERAVALLSAEPSLSDAPASYVSADLSRRSGVDEVITVVEERLGAPDILVNCAGVNLRPPLAELTDADVEQTMAVNTTAPLLLGQRFGPQMAARGWGRIINVGSQQSVSAFGNSGVYGVSKAAVAGLSRSQAEAWSSSGVCCNTIVPGFVITPMTEHVVAEPGREAALAARTMVGRNGRPDDFAGTAVFLASNASSYVTGQLVFVDGGFSVH